MALEYDSDTWLGAFASAGYDHGKGEVTVFMGPRLKSNPGQWGPNATIKDGLYVTVGTDGSVRDFGIRVETSSTIGTGQTGSASIKLDSMDFSFVGISPIATLMGE